MPKFNLKKFAAILKIVAPLVLMTVPHGEKIAEFIDPITKAIGEAQQIKGASGVEKKAHVLGVLDAAVTAANASGRVTVDSIEVQRIASEGIDQTIAKIHEVEAVVAAAK